MPLSLIQYLYLIILYPTSTIQHRFYHLSTIHYPTSNIINVSNKKGHTIIELITAISVTLIISTMIFAAYLAIFKEFNFFTRKADAVMETVVTKKKMDALFSDIKTVSAVYKTTLEYIGKNNKKHILTFRNGSLFLDNARKIDKLNNFTYSVSEKQGAIGRYLLLWDVVLSNKHWIGGAKEVIQE